MVRDCQKVNFGTSGLENPDLATAETWRYYMGSSARTVSSYSGPIAVRNNNEAEALAVLCGIRTTAIT